METLLYELSLVERSGRVREAPLEVPGEPYRASGDGGGVRWSLFRMEPIWAFGLGRGVHVPHRTNYYEITSSPHTVCLSRADVLRSARCPV